MTIPFAFLATFLNAQALVWEDPVDVATEESGDRRPRVVVNATGHPVVLWSASDGACFTAMGMGVGFMAPVRVNPEGTTIAAADWQGPAIASSGDVLWAVFKALPEENAPCYLVESTNGGASWGDTLRLDPDDGLVSRFPSVAITDDGSPVVQYMQFTSGYLEPRMVVRAWSNGSPLDPAPVSAPYAPGEVCDCCTGEVEASGSGVVAIYRNAGGNIRTIWGAASTDGGATFPVGAEVDNTDWFLAACPSSGPDLCISGDSIRYVWMSGEENGTKVYLASAHAATLALGAQIHAHPGQVGSLQQNYPRIAGSGDTLGLVWEQNFQGQREILFAWSTNGIGGLGVPDTVNTVLTAAQRTPDIAFADGAFHIVWSEPATGQIRYRRAHLLEGTGVPVPSPASAMRIHYDGLMDRVLISGLVPRTCQLFDASGRILFSASGPTQEIPVQGVVPGCYLVRAVDDSGRAHLARFFKP